MFYESHMGQALEEAKISSRIGEVPIGAVIINSVDGALIASCGNRVETLKDPTAHAEILALREAAKLLKTPRLNKCDLYVTLEPCAMCAQAISLARIRRLYYAVEDQKGGGVDNGARVYSNSGCNHRPEIYSGMRETEAKKLLRSFFFERR